MIDPNGLDTSKTVRSVVTGVILLIPGLFIVGCYLFMLFGLNQSWFEYLGIVSAWSGIAVLGGFSAGMGLVLITRGEYAVYRDYYLMNRAITSSGRRV